MSVFLLHPIMLSTAVIGAAIVALHLFLPRWKHRRVASLMIWRRVAARGAGLSARRLSIDAVLILAGLAAACLVVASADPRSIGERRNKSGLVVVIDNGTASATEGTEDATRLAEAARLAHEDVDALASGSEVAVIVTSPSPSVLRSWGSAAAASESIDDVESVFVSGDLSEAVALALAVGPPTATVRIYTSRSIGEVPIGVERRVVGARSRNIAFVRAEFAATEVFCALRNYGSRDVSTVVSMHVVEPPPVREIAREEVSIAAGERADLILIPRIDLDTERADIVRLSHSAVEDDLDADDEVWGARLPGSAARIGVVGRVGEPLSRALWAARAEVIHLSPGDGANATEMDLCVYADAGPSTWPPAGPCILVAPQKDVGPVSMLGDELTDVSAFFEGADSPNSLVYGVASNTTLRVSNVLRARLFGEHERIIVAGGETLAARFYESGRQHIYLGFKPEDSDWCTRASFPVFVARALAAAKSGGGRSRLGFARVGDAPDDMLPPDAASVTRGGDEFSRAAILTAPGLYRIGLSGDRRLAVNLLDARESDTRIAPADTVAREPGMAGDRSRERFEAVGLAGVLCALALALCAGEWCLSAKRD